MRRAVSSYKREEAAWESAGVRRWTERERPINQVGTLGSAGRERDKLTWTIKAAQSNLQRQRQRRQHHRQRQQRLDYDSICIDWPSRNKQLKARNSLDCFACSLTDWQVAKAVNGNSAVSGRIRKGSFISSAALDMLTTTTTTTTTERYNPLNLRQKAPQKLPTRHARIARSHLALQCHYSFSSCCYYPSRLITTAFQAAPHSMASNVNETLSTRGPSPRAGQRRHVGVVGQRQQQQWRRRRALRRVVASVSCCCCCSQSPSEIHSEREQSIIQQLANSNTRLVQAAKSRPFEDPAASAKNESNYKRSPERKGKGKARELRGIGIGKREAKQQAKSKPEARNKPAVNNSDDSDNIISASKKSKLFFKRDTYTNTSVSSQAKVMLSLLLLSLTQTQATGNNFVIIKQLIAPKIEPLNSVYLESQAGQQQLHHQLQATLSNQLYRAEHRNVPTATSGRRIRAAASSVSTASPNLEAADAQMEGDDAEAEEAEAEFLPPRFGGHFSRHSGHDLSDARQQRQGARAAAAARLRRRQISSATLIGRHKTISTNNKHSTQNDNLLLARPKHSSSYRNGRLLLMNQNAASAASASACAQVQECTCLWKNGKQNADCSSGQLSKVPPNLDPLTQVLNLSSNPLVHLATNAFQAANLTNLQRIYLSSCQLQSVHPKAFERLKLVVELELAWNKFVQVPLIQISQLKLLRKFSMRGNPLGSLDESTFQTTEKDFLATLEPQVTGPTTTTTDRFQDDQLEPDEWSPLRANLSRLIETYPELAAALVHNARQLEAEQQSGIGGSKSASSLGYGPSSEWATGKKGAQLVLGLMELLRSLQLDTDSMDQSGGSGGNSLPGGDYYSSNEESILLGAHFSQLQELDFGHCQLTYISWKAFQGLSQLKRLYLDNNKLSQLSGRLILALPLGLHQLALEGNPFVCDCRLLALKRWLSSTRTPLSAPVKCHQDVVFRNQLQQHPRIKQPVASVASAAAATATASATSQRDEPAGSLSATDIASQAAATAEDLRLVKDEDEQREEGLLVWRHKTRPEEQTVSNELAEISLDHFVCAPQAPTETQLALNSASSGSMSSSSWLSINRVVQPEQLIHYLWPTLIRFPREHQQAIAHTQTTSNSTSRSQHQQQPNRQLILAQEGDKVTLRCPLIVYPDWSVHFVWLADYSRAPPIRDSAQPVQSSPSPSAGRLPAEERLVVLYDSRLHTRSARQPERHTSSGFGDLATSPRESIAEFSLHGARLSVREFSQGQLTSASSTANEVQVPTQPALEFAVKESQLIIQSAHPNDSARYRCVASNRAGNVSSEFLLRVSPLEPAVAASSAGARELRHQQHLTTSLDSLDGTSKHQQTLSFNGQSRTLTQGSGAVPTGSSSSQQQQQQQQQQEPQSSSSWLRGSTTFQVTIVLVSLLMGAVIVTFLLFCIVIYQIKPNTSTGQTQLVRTMAPSLEANLERSMTEYHQLSSVPMNGTLVTVNKQQPFDTVSMQNTSYTTTSTTGDGIGTGTASLYLPIQSPQMRLTSVNCDPITGHSPVHLIAQPQMPQIATQQQYQHQPQAFVTGFGSFLQFHKPAAVDSSAPYADSNTNWTHQF